MMDATPLAILFENGPAVNLYKSEQRSGRDNQCVGIPAAHAQGTTLPTSAAHTKGMKSIQSGPPQQKPSRNCGEECPPSLLITVKGCLVTPGVAG